MASGLRWLTVAGAWWCVLVCLAGAQDALAVEGEAVVPRPEIHIPESIFDFGTLKSGAAIEHDFVIENRGTAPLTIKHVRTSCGCTAGNVKPSEIVPGGQGILHVRFDTGHRVGKQKKSVYVLTNAPDTPKAVCCIEGMLEKPVTISRVGVKGTANALPRVRKSEKAAKILKDPQVSNADANIQHPDNEQIGTPHLVVSEGLWNAGAVRRGTAIEHDFVLKNTGEASLTISRVRTSCGCTRPRLSAEMIPPGESGVLHASMDTKGRRGPQRITITLSTNDPALPTAVLTIISDITSVIQVDPSALYFQDARIGKAESRQFSVVGEKGADPGIADVSSNLPFIGAEIVADPPPEGAGQKIVQVTLGTDAPLGPFSGWVSVTLADNLDPVRRVRVAGKVIGDIDVAPLSLRLKSSDPTGMTIRLVLREGEPFEMGEVSAEQGHVRCDVRTVDKGTHYEIQVSPSVPAGVSTKHLSDVVLIHTSKASLPVIRVPVTLRG